MVINLYQKTTEDFKNLSDKKIESIMREVNFINQNQLKNILLNLKILVRKDRMQYTDIVQFDGQLEKGKIENRPHWQLTIIK